MASFRVLIVSFICTAFYRVLSTKGKERSCTAVNGTPSHSYRVSFAIWDHPVLPLTRHKWTHPALTAAVQTGTRFTYPGGMKGW